jgi:EmrB/QacA subfamily drug resistance transporter
VIAIVAFLTTIDNTIVNVALPAIQRDLSMSVAALEWVVTGYLITFAALMLTGGRLADRYGTRRILLLGLAVFIAASLLAGVAQDAAMLLVARAIQGSGAALALPAGLAVVAAAPTQRERDLGAATWMAALATALAAGPVVGGWLSQHLSWNWIFLVNLPPGIVGLLIGWAAIKKDRPGDAMGVDTAGLDTAGLDVGGLACSAVALAAATFVLIEGPGIGWGSPQVVAAAVIAGVAAILFGRTERRCADPAVDSTVLRERTVQGGLAASVLWGVGVNGVFFFTSLFLQRAAGFSATRTGLVFLPIAALVVLVTPVTPAIAARFGAARTVAAGLVLVSAGLAVVALTLYHVTALRLLPGVAMIGAGSALTVPLTTSVLAAVPPSRTGAASGLLSVAREASGLAGIAVIGLIVTGGHPLPARGAVSGTFVRGYGTGLTAAAGLVLIGAVIAARTLPGRRKSPPDTGPGMLT